ncbi:MAG: EamA family transporter [Candidatus Peribacteraceae bacterium]|nr:EamA family transporter [Candidatus Peribacteraceae bacterium]
MWLLFVLLSALSWALVNVLDSGLVRQYEKHPAILLWSQSLFSIPILIGMALVLDVQTSFWWILLLAGMIAYLGDMCVFLLLDRIDASVSNLSWALLAIFISIIGFLFFHETWTSLQAGGALLVLSGALILSFWRRDIFHARVLLPLFGLALLYLPFYVAKKAALLENQTVWAVLFWLLIGRELLCIFTPVAIPSLRSRVVALVRRVPLRFYLGSAVVIIVFFLGEYFGTVAYDLGKASLVAIVGNVQLFLVIALAWVFSRFIPAFVPRELLDSRSVLIKAVSFAFVFVGLALLSVSQ